MRRLRWAAVLALSLAGAAAWAQGTNVNPFPGSVWTYLGATYGAGWAAPVANGVINVAALGADPTGNTDNAAIVTTACIQAFSLAVPLYFPPGNYKFLSRINCSAPNSTATLTVLGAGQAATNLFWLAAPGGWNITTQTSENAVHFRDLTLSCNAAGCGTAVAITETGTSTYAFAEQSDFTRVTITGSDHLGTTYWDFGVVPAGMSNISFVGFNFWGSGLTTAKGVGLNLTDTGTVPNGVVYQITNSNFGGGQYGIQLGSGSQGLQVVNTNFTGPVSGIYASCLPTSCVQISVTGNSQFQTTGHAIDLEGAGANVTIANNLFYCIQNFSCIYINEPDSAGGLFIITGNQFNPYTGTSKGNGVYVNNSSSFASGLIDNNLFSNLNTPITLCGAAIAGCTGGATAYGWTIGAANSFLGNTFPTTHNGSNVNDASFNSNYASCRAWSFQSSTNVSGVANFYIGSSFLTGAEGNTENISPHNALLKHLVAGVPTAPGGSGSLIFTEDVDGVPKALTFTLTTSNLGSCCDGNPAANVFLAEGDAFTTRVQGTGTYTAVPVSGSVEYCPIP